ncbi:hypothetical protein SK128_023769 [Halocaridina rubra]|uniref:Peptidase S1 domain-containing protein n=1 Tax=Halocaridina rubra TaxID=373956 RepID=A0AAN9A890_HALRR
MANICITPLLLIKISSSGTSSYPDQLQEVTIFVVKNERCKQDYGASKITQNMLCAGLDKGGKDSCQGDSGGPLITEEKGKYVQIGVVSWGYFCASPNYYGVYARVTKYLGWISSEVGGYGYCST